MPLVRSCAHCNLADRRRVLLGMREAQEMTIPFERTRALISAKEFLEAMMDPKQTPRTPRWMRGKAKALLRHYPGLCEIELAHKALPEVYGPVPPFPRLRASEQTQGVINSTKGSHEL